MTSSNRPATSRRPLTLAAIRPSASARVGPASVRLGRRGLAVERPACGSRSRVVPWRGPSAGGLPSRRGRGQGEPPAAGRYGNGTVRCRSGAMAQRYQRAPRDSAGSSGRRLDAAPRSDASTRSASARSAAVPDPAQDPDHQAGAGRAGHREVRRGVADDRDPRRLAWQGPGTARRPHRARASSRSRRRRRPSPRPPPGRRGRAASRRSGARSSVVATAMRRPPVAERAEEGGRSASGSARATGSGTNQAASVARRAAATLGHQRRRTAATVSWMPAIVAVARGPPARHATGRRVEADRREHVPRDRPAGRRLEPRPELARPAAPHRVEVDERAVLVEDDEVDAASSIDRSRRPRLQQRLRGRQGVASVGHGVAAEDQARLRREAEDDRRPAGGTARFGLLNVST